LIFHAHLYFGWTINDGSEIETTSQNEIIWKGLGYNTVTSPHTGRIWLDRNLGATQVCTAYNDSACYGDYYQWGRNSDGHEKLSSDTTSIQATNVTTVGHSKFIKDPINDGNGDQGDWALDADQNGSIRYNNWRKLDGTSICPVGFRVPTKNEIKAETTDIQGFDDNTDAFESFLKIPSAGFRDSSSAYSRDKNSAAYIWSNSPSNTDAYLFTFYKVNSFIEDSTFFSLYYRAAGASIRCVKN
jgi:hypothetical protein